MSQLEDATQAATTLSINRWWRLVGGLSMNLALGTLYAWSVFVTPLEAQFGWKRTETSMTFTIATVVFALTFVLGGRLQDRIGPFWVSVAGGLLVSVGFFMCSYTQTLNWLYLWFGVVAGMGNGFGYATPIPVMAKWFPDRRGLAVGLAVAGYGAGSAIFGPLCADWLIPEFGLATTFRVLGVIFLVMTLFGAFLLRNPPAGYRPAGWSPPDTNDLVRPTSRDFTPGEVLKTPTFYWMWLAYALGTSSGLMVISQLMPFTKEKGVAAAVASSALLVGSIGNAAGRTLAGWMSDLLGRLNVLRLMIGVSIAAMPLLYILGGSTAGLFVMVFIVYWCYGTQLSVNATTAADFWGTKNAGVNYGILFTAWGVAGILGPRIGSSLFVSYGSYLPAFQAAAGLAAAALICELIARRPRPPAVEAL